MRQLILGLLLWIPTQAFAEGLPELLACMHANVPASVRVQDIKLTATDRDGGTRVIEGRVAATQEKDSKGQVLVRSVLRVKAPASFAGAAYLIREAGQDSDPGVYVYLPSVRRVRHVTGRFADGALLGTDFSYQDFKQLQYAFSGSNIQLDGEDTIESRRALQLSFVPKLARESRYSKVRMWVDAQSCVPLKAQFLSGDKLVKELTASLAGLRQSGKSWYASQLRMKDLSAGTETELSVSDVSAAVTLSPKLFQPESFYLGGGP